MNLTYRAKKYYKLGHNVDHIPHLKSSRIVHLCVHTQWLCCGSLHFGDTTGELMCEDYFQEYLICYLLHYLL